MPADQKHKMTSNFFKEKKLFFLGCFIAILVAFLDLFSKRAIFMLLESDQYSDHFIEVTGFFNLVHVWNNGVSFGMFSNFEYSKIIFSVIVTIILVIMLVWLYRNRDLYLTFAIAFIIGGAIGNLYDRLKYGAVADFLDFHINTYHWPAFNIADSFVFIGVVLLLVEDLILKKK